MKSRDNMNFYGVIVSTIALFLLAATQVAMATDGGRTDKPGPHADGVEVIAGTGGATGGTTSTGGTTGSVCESCSSEHGYCASNTCYCVDGWTGTNCDEPIDGGSGGICPPDDGQRGADRCAGS